MRSKPEPPFVKPDWKVEEKIVAAFKKMEKLSKQTSDEMVHVALKQYISRHKDWMPKE